MFELLGKIFLAFLIAFALVLAAALTLLYIVFKHKKIYFPHFILSVFESSHNLGKKIISFFGGDDEIVDIVLVEIRNIILRENFAKTEYKDRVIFIPQCMRDINCPGKLNPAEGIKCIKCKKCKISEIIEYAEKLGYKGVFIVPGGGFVKRIIRRVKPKAVLGVSCAYETNAGMYEVSKLGIPSQGVLLSRSGCITTDVELEKLFSVMELKI